MPRETPVMAALDPATHAGPTTGSSPAMTIVAALSGAVFLAVCSHIRIPMWPVPMTMQPFAVLLIGGALAPRAAVGAVLAYLAVAAAGLPVLAGATGLGGPTTGYLLSYILVAAGLATARERGLLRHPLALLGGLVAAMAVIYGAGVSWLAAFWLHDLAAAARAGMVPFLPGDAVKVALAFTCLATYRRRFG